MEGGASTKQAAGRWSKEEHELFLCAVKRHGREWAAVATVVTTRTSAQIRSHAQKHFNKVTALAPFADQTQEDAYVVLEMCEKVLSQLKHKRKLTVLPPGHVGSSNPGDDHGGDGDTGGFGIGLVEVTPPPHPRDHDNNDDDAVDMYEDEDRAHHASTLASLAAGTATHHTLPRLLPPPPPQLPLPPLPPSSTSSSSLSSTAAHPPTKRTKHLDPTALDESELIALEALLCNAKGYPGAGVGGGHPLFIPPVFPTDLLAEELFQFAATAAPAPAASDYGDTSGADSTDDASDDASDTHRYGFQHARVGAVVLAIPVVVGPVVVAGAPVKVVDPLYLANMQLHFSRQKPL